MNFLRLCSLLIAAAIATVSQAIIMRHDGGARLYEVRSSSYPAIFYLELINNHKVCVATLIDRQWAITAAHCLGETSVATVVRNGGRFAVTLAGTERFIDQVVSHPDYLPGSANEVDLALLRFSEPLPFPQPYAMNSSSAEQDAVVSLLGWGYSGLGTTGRQRDDGTLRRAENRVSLAAQRLEIVFDDPRWPDSTALPLEGTPGLNDSGGPALMLVEGEAVLAGVAVGEFMDADFDEETQGRYGAVAVYERISRHLAWIAEVTASSAKVSGE